MKKRIAVVAFLLTTAITTAASAELSLGMGTRWTAFRNNLAIMVPTDVGGASASGGNLAYATPNGETALDAYFMLAFSKKFGLYLQLDYMNVSWACTGDNTGDCDGGDDDFGDAAFSTFGLELGIKFYFAEPRRAAISPLLTFGGFAYFSSVTGSESDEDLQIALSDLSSPLGLRLAIGVEYNFSNNFSVGAEVFGLRFATASTSVGEGAAVVESDADTSYTSLSMYTALTLNFRFYGLFRVYTREEEEQGRQEEAEDRQENQQWQQQQNQWNQQGTQQQNPNQNQQWQQQQNPNQNQQWQQQQNPNQQWQQPTPPPQDPNQQWQQPQGGTPPPVQ